MSSYYAFCLLFIALSVHLSSGQSKSSLYRGKFIGRITPRKHKVSGDVYAVDSRTLHIRDFTYDGTGPDAFFWTGFTETPTNQGIIIPNEKGTKEVLAAYNKQDITISLPDGLTLRDIKWIAVWCRAYEVNFGDLFIPANFDFPQPHVIGSIIGQHGVTSGPIVVVDAQTILVPDFTYDGQAPDLHYWVGRGAPGPQGIRVADETGGDSPLIKANKKTMVLSLPGDLTVFDIDYFGVWCRLYSIDFGHVRIQANLNVPPSLRMLGVAPQSKLNCEVLNEDLAFEVRWSIVESGETVVFQLVGRVDPGHYMAFGLSGESERSVMIGGDAMIGWFNPDNGEGSVVDYYLGSKSVCNLGTGSCPDVQHKDGVNNARMLSSASVNGFTILTFQRKLSAIDRFDRQILTNGSQPVIWAVGPIQNELAVYHSLHSKDDFSIDFGRAPKWNCPEPEPEPDSAESSLSSAKIVSTNSLQQSSLRLQGSHSHKDTIVGPVAEIEAKVDHKTSIVPPAWRIPDIPCNEPEDRVLYAQLGPSGRKEFYKTITGKDVKPDYVWYINGLLMPEIYLVRNKNYTFVVQGGDNELYITDDPVGDFSHKSEIERQKWNIYAGVGKDAQGRNIPTSMGKLCQWIETGNQPADYFTSYAAYQRVLSLDCRKGHSGVLQFTPDANTPSTLYYQSYSKGHLGWKIHIVDKCENGNQEGIVSKPQLVPDKAVPTITPNIDLFPRIGLDQRFAESINRDSVVALASSNPGQTVNLDIQQSSGSRFPLENAFLMGTSIEDGKVTFTNVHSLPHESTRLIFNAKPAESVTQGPSLGIGNTREGQIVAFPPQGAFQIPQNANIYRMTMDPSLIESSGRLGQNLYSPSVFNSVVRVPNDANLLRRNGAPYLTSVPYKGQKYGERPEIIYESKPEQYYMGANRQALMSHPIRYDTGSALSGMYTTSPPQRMNSPLAYIHQHHERPSEYQHDLSMRIAGPGQIMRMQNLQSIPSRRTDLSSVSVPDNSNVKYIEYPRPTIQLMQNDGSVPSHGWPQSRNLPKRDHSRQQPSYYLSGGSILGGLRETGRDSRNDKAKKGDDQNGVTLQNHPDVGGRKGVKIGASNSPATARSGESTTHNDEDENAGSASVALANASSETLEEEKSGHRTSHLPTNNCKGTEHNAGCFRKETVETVEDSEKDHSNSQPQSRHPATEPVFQNFGPVFRPSLPDTDSFFNVTSQFQRQQTSNLELYVLPNSKGNLNLISPSRSISEPVMLSPSLNFIKRNPPQQRPSGLQYRLQDYPSFSPFHTQSLPAIWDKRPGSTASTFREIMQLLMPKSNTRIQPTKHENKFIFRERGHPHKKFPPRQQNLLARSDTVAFDSVPSMYTIGSERNPNQKQNGSLTQTNKAQIREDVPTREDNQSNGPEVKNAEEENLSLTLLTDVWQIINQQGVSKPPAAENIQQQAPILQQPANLGVRSKGHFLTQQPMTIDPQGFVHQNSRLRPPRDPQIFRGSKGSRGEEETRQNDETEAKTSHEKNHQVESLFDGQQLPKLTYSNNYTRTALYNLTRTDSYLPLNTSNQYVRSILSSYQFS